MKRYMNYKTGKMLRSLGVGETENYYHAQMHRARRIRRAHDIIGFLLCSIATAGFVGTFVYYQLFR